MRLFNRLEDQFKTDNVYHITVTTKFSSLRRGHGPANTTKNYGGTSHIYYTNFQTSQIICGTLKVKMLLWFYHDLDFYQEKIVKNIYELLSTKLRNSPPSQKTFVGFQDVLKTSLTFVIFQDVFNTSWKTRSCQLKASSRYFGDQRNFYWEGIYICIQQIQNCM